jgi:predicted P-loop ATPase
MGPAPIATAVKFVLYLNKSATAPRQENLPWDRFVNLLINYPEESPCSIEEGASGAARCVGKECLHKSHSSFKDNPMAWSPVDIVGNRLDANVRALTALSLDFDHIKTEHTDKIVTALAGVEHAWYTTHNHRGVTSGVDDTCVRFVLRLSRPVTSGEWHRFLKTAIAFLGVAVETGVNKKGRPVFQPDPTCKDRSRLYYRQSYPRGAPHTAGEVLGRDRGGPGLPLDVDEVLRWGVANVLPETAVADAAPLPETSTWDLEGEPVLDAIDCIVRFFPPVGRRHELALALGGMLRRAGAPEDDAYYVVSEAFRQGGSQNYEARAATVAHTYALTDDGWMTGFTRACEILGQEEAEEFGDYLTDASNAALLRALGAGRAGTGSSQETGSSGATGPVAVKIQAPLSFDEARKRIKSAANKKMKSSEPDDCVFGLLLRRVLEGKPLALPGGHGDVETAPSWTPNQGVGREAAIKQVIGCIAFTLPDTTAWDLVVEIVRPSIAALGHEGAPGGGAGGGGWLAFAEKTFQRAQDKRRIKNLEQEAETQAERARARVGALAASGQSHLALVNTPVLPPTDGLDWADKLMKGAKGEIAQTFHNVRVLLQNHADFWGFLRWNKVSKQIEVTGGPLKQYTRYEDDDEDDNERLVRGFQDYLSHAHGVTISSIEALGGRMLDVARLNSYDPIQDYLKSLVWDGTPRMSTWLYTYCGAKDDEEYHEAVGRRFLIALVARAFKPGCKVDNVLVLDGEGGIGKSSVFAILAGQWFCDTLISLGDKDSRMLAGQYWICEMAELVAFKNSSHDALKNFFSSSTDKFRLPYGRKLKESKRRCLFVGTTNDAEYLTDETGNRKYLPVTCSFVPGALDNLARDRDQIFAEAVAAYEAGERWHFKFNEIADLLNEQAEKHKVMSPCEAWAERILDWWYNKAPEARPSEMTVSYVAMEVGGMSVDKVTRSHMTSIGVALKKAGFRHSYKRVWYPSDKLSKAPKGKPRHMFAVPSDVVRN